MTRFLSKDAPVLAFLVALYLSLAYFFVSILKYDFLRSDVLSYWLESIKWMTPFNEHPPLYALVIALVRSVTFNLLNPVVLMIGINLIAFSGCVLFVMLYSQAAGVGREYGVLAALLFALWPFVGLTYTVVPLADIPAMVLTLAGFVLLQRSRQVGAAILFGLAIITHKGVWPIVGLVTIADFYMRREFFSKRNLLFLVIMFFPLAILWAGGASYHNSANWLMERSLQVNTSMGGGYLVLDGLFGTFQQGGVKGLVKGLIVLFFLILSIVSLVTSLKLKYKYYEFSVAVSVAVLVMLLFSSAETIWGPIRFSRFLVFPLIFGLHSTFGDKLAGRTAISVGLVLLAGLYVTQLAYAWYIARVFYG